MSRAGEDERGGLRVLPVREVVLAHLFADPLTLLRRESVGRRCRIAPAVLTDVPGQDNLDQRGPRQASAKGTRQYLQSWMTKKRMPKQHEQPMTPGVYRGASLALKTWDPTMLPVQ